MTLFRSLTGLYFCFAAFASPTKAETNIWYYEPLGMRMEYGDDWKVLPPQAPNIFNMEVRGVDEFGDEYGQTIAIRVVKGSPGDKLQEEDIEQLRKHWASSGGKTKASEKISINYTEAYYIGGDFKDPQGNPLYADQYLFKLDGKLVSLQSLSLFHPEEDYIASHPGSRSIISSITFKGHLPPADKAPKDWGIANTLTLKPAKGWFHVTSKEDFSMVCSDDWMSRISMATKQWDPEWDAEWEDRVDPKDNRIGSRPLTGTLGIFTWRRGTYMPEADSRKAGKTTIAGKPFKWESGTHPKGTPQLRRKVFHGKVGDQLVAIICEDWEAADKPYPAEALLKNIEWK